MLLAKAGLLDNVKFTSGMWDEICRGLDFIPYENIVHQPIIKDRNFITAMGFAYREFAIETIKALGVDDCKDGLFNGIPNDYKEEDLIYEMGESNFKEFMKEYNSYLIK